MPREILADITHMEKVYQENIKALDDTLCIGDCFILKYLLETFEVCNGMMLQFGKGSGVEFEVIGGCLRPGYRVLLVDPDAEKGELEQCLVTPLAPMDAFPYLSDVVGRLGILFINEYDFVPYYFRKYEEFLVENGYVVVRISKDDTPLEDILGYFEGNQKYQKFYQTEQLVIYRLIAPFRAKLLDGHNRYMQKKLDAIYGRVSEIHPPLPTVALGVLTFNHAPFIEECLDGVFSQTGAFRKKIVIVDDHSSDGTAELIDQYLRVHVPDVPDTQIVVIHNEKNMGALWSIGILFEELQNGSDYFTYIEGDDYWSSEERVQKHLNILNKNPEFAFSVNAFQLLLQEQKKFVSGNRFSKLAYSRNNTYDLLMNYIGDAGCYVYRSSLLKKADFEQVKRMQIEWQLVLLLSTMGDCYFLEEEMNVRRVHMGGTWSTLTDEMKDLTKIAHLIKMNQELDLMFDDAFSQKCVQMMKECFVSYRSRYDLMIFDHLLSLPRGYGIREECKFLLEQVELSSLAVDYHSTQFQTRDRALEVLHEIRKKNPGIAAKIWAMYGWCLMSAKILLVFGAEMAYMSLSICERYQIPFVPVIDDEVTISSEDLCRVLRSEMCCGTVIKDAVTIPDELKYSGLCENDTLVLPKGCFGTEKCGEKILDFVQELKEKIDYDKLRDDKLLFDTEYAEHNGLHDQFHIWEINQDDILGRGKVYRFLKKIYLKLCPNKIKPYVKKVYKYLTGQQT